VFPLNEPALTREYRGESPSLRVARLDRHGTPEPGSWLARRKAHYALADWRFTTADASMKLPEISGAPAALRVVERAAKPRRMPSGHLKA